MGFDLTKFAIENLIEGYNDGSFSKAQINIFSMNYMMKGILSKDDIDFINSEMELIDERREREKLEQEELEKELEELENESDDVEINPPLVIEE